jgi:peroxiredoxin
MAQLRLDYDKFVQLDAEVVVVCPEDEATVAEHWQSEGYPFVGLADPRHSVAKLYGQEVNLFKLGRMPMMAVLDKEGRVVYEHHAASMSDIPSNESILKLLKTP